MESVQYEAFDYSVKSIRGKVNTCGVEVYTKGQVQHQIGYVQIENPEYGNFNIEASRHRFCNNVGLSLSDLIKFALVAADISGKGECI